MQTEICNVRPSKSMTRITAQGTPVDRRKCFAPIGNLPIVVAKDENGKAIAFHLKNPKPIKNWFKRTHTKIKELEVFFGSEANRKRFENLAKKLDLKLNPPILNLDDRSKTSPGFLMLYL